jgi:hypothetical protein
MSSKTPIIVGAATGATLGLLRTGLRFVIAGVEGRGSKHGSHRADTLRQLAPNVIVPAAIGGLLGAGTSRVVRRLRNR